MLMHASWDQHTNLNKALKKNCDITDQPTAALIKDLKQRGLLDSTLVVWGGEFGRTPMVEIRNTSDPDERAAAIIIRRPTRCGWPAAASSRGTTIGETDDLGFKIAEDPVHVHDLQATMLHCLGHGSHAADLPPHGPRLPADGRRGQRRAEDAGLESEALRAAGASRRWRQAEDADVIESPEIDSDTCARCHGDFFFPRVAGSEDRNEVAHRIARPTEQRSGTRSLFAPDPDFVTRPRNPELPF